MSFVTYLVVKQKLKQVMDMSSNIKKSCLWHLVIVIYLIGMAGYRRHERNNEDKDKTTPSLTFTYE